LQLAGVPSTARLWTGSCPCQPFSIAGKGEGVEDERHLWPEFFRLIRECRPERVVGEQVANAIGKGWLDGISADLESEDYACGAVVLGAHSVGAPHLRQRLYWLADNRGRRREVEVQHSSSSKASRERETNQSGSGRLLGGLGLPDGTGRVPRGPAATPAGQGHPIEPAGSWLVQSGIEGSQGHPGDGDHWGQSGWFDPKSGRPTSEASRPWETYELLDFIDGKQRRIEPGLEPMAHGVSGRVGLLRGYGNAIVPQVAAEFLKAFFEED